MHWKKKDEAKEESSAPTTTTESPERHVALWLQRMNLRDWIQQQMNTGLLIRQNLIAGIARGLGMALGAGIVLAILTTVVLFLRHLLGL
jgi:hypothetical protein